MGLTIDKEPTFSFSRLVRIDVHQYHKMIEAGILPEGAPIELIDGLLVQKDRSARGENPMSVSTTHCWIVTQLMELFNPLLRQQALLQLQNPIRIGTVREPEPDGAILRGMPDDYKDRLPTAADVVCVMEVSDSSLAFDRETKLNLYAEAGIPQYVIFNIPDRRIEVYEEPVAAEGRYARQTEIKAGGTVSFHIGGGKCLDAPADRFLP